MSFAAALAAIGEAGAAVGGALGSAGTALGSALGLGGEAAAGGVLGAGSGAAGGAGFGGLTSGSLLGQVGQGLGALKTVQGMSNNNPNSGMVQGVEPIPVSGNDNAFNQMMSQAISTPQPQPRQQINPVGLHMDSTMLPWTAHVDNIVKKRQAEDNTSMQLGQLLGLLAQGQTGLPQLHSVEDSGGSGAGGSSGGLVKGILSKL
jgi:hypothetical protein